METESRKRCLEKPAAQRWQTLLLYAVVWTICVLIIWVIFKSNDRVFLWDYDGTYQHFCSFQYLCDYLKDLVYHQNTEGFFNFTLGQGMDTLTTLDSYDFTDPISIVCALIFPLSRVGRYTLMIFVKLFLVGGSFLFYCFSIGKENRFSVSAGAIAYTFSGAILFMFAYHPNYINWAYFLPFLLGSIELFRRKKKRVPLVIFVLLNVVTSFYTFYINIIIVVIYVAAHAICKIVKEKKRSAAWEEVKCCLKLIALVCVGVLLASFILLPTLSAYLNNARIADASGYTASLWHYPLDYYLKLFVYLFSPKRYGSYTSYIGLNAVMLVPVVLLFTKRRQNTALKWILVVCALMMCIPLAGRMMNGFGYASNRWAFAIPFFVSVAFVMMFPDIKKMTSKEKACVLLVTVAYIALSFLHTETNSDSLKYSALIMMAAVTLALWIVLKYNWPPYQPVMFSLVAVGACFQAFFTFSVSQGDIVSTFLESSRVDSRYEDYSSSAASDLDDTFYRIETEETDPNVSGYNGVNGTGFYWSMAPSYVFDYYTDLALNTVENNCFLKNLGGRTGLLAIASVKYYTRPEKEDGFVPYGYDEIETEEPKYQVYENEYALPIGYTYSHYIPSDQYDLLNGIEKEQALLQGAVLDEPIDGVEGADLEFDYEPVDYEVVGTDNVALTGHNMEFTEKSGTVTLRANIPENCEIYVYMKGVELLGDSTYLDLNVTRTKGENSFTRTARLSTLNYQWPVLRDDVCYDMGVGNAGENTFVLSGQDIGSVSYDEIQIIAVPTASYVNDVTKLGEYVLEDISVEKDKVSGTISLPDSRILQLSIPYSTGWKAYVDGEETDLLKSDVMYMAIPLTAGDHTIELYYATPYLKVGLVVSGSALVLWILFEVIERNRRKKRQ